MHMLSLESAKSHLIGLTREAAPLVNVLVGIDNKISRKFAIVAANRLSDNRETVEQILTALRRMGHFGDLELHTDGEPSLIQLMQTVAARRSAQTFVRRSPPYDSQANGRVERCVRSIEESARALKLDLEGRIGMRISVHDNVFPWLLRHSTMILNWRQPGFGANVWSSV